MSGLAPALLVAGAGVGFAHAVMPDHWMPLAVVGRVNRYSARRVARLAALAGVAHVIVSLVLGAVIVVVGLQFRGSLERAQDTIVGSILLLTGVGFIGLELAGRGHHHGPGGHGHGHPHSHHVHGDARAQHRDHGDAHAHVHDDDTHVDGHDHGHGHHAGLSEHASPRQRLFAVLIPFGAAASPDLTILPVFLAAAAAGTAAAVGTLVVFSVATIATIVALTVVAFLTGYRLEGDWLERWGNVITAGVLLVIGGLVITQVI